MSQSQTNWDDDIPYNSEDEYQALLRALRRKQGFGLYFVQCSPAEGEKIIQRVQTDLTQKRIEVLKLEESLEQGDFYERVEGFLQAKGNVEILFIQGLEYSLYDYEETKKRLGWSSKEIYSYSWKGVPRILSHLNQQRERFRDNFNTCFVFLVPLFLIKYFIQRAPDFFDWRSGVFRFPSDLQRGKHESQQLDTGDYENYAAMSSRERWQNILYIRELLEEPEQTSAYQAELLSNLGLLFHIEQDYENALVSWDKAIKFKPDDYKSWLNKGLALSHLDREEDAIASYDKATKLDSDDHRAWFYKGIELRYLERYEEALSNFDKALSLANDNANVWYWRSIVLQQLKKHQKAVEGLEKALSINSKIAHFWYVKGIAEEALDRYEDAIDSFKKALEIEPENSRIWASLAHALYYTGHREDAISSNSKALELNNNNRSTYWLQGAMLLDLGAFDDAILMFDKYVESKTKNSFAWLWRGYSLYYAKRYVEALESFDQAIQLETEIDINTGWWWNLGGTRLHFKSNPTYLYLLGRSLVLLRLNRYREAFMSFKEFLLNSNPYQDLLVILKAIYSRDLRKRQAIVALKIIAGNLGLKASKK